MLNRFKTALVSALNTQEESALNGDQQKEKPAKFPYRRPAFLDLDSDAMAVYSDHKMRPVLHPNFSSLPHNTGYAECINAGKSRFNEDQAVCLKGVLLCPYAQNRRVHIPYTYYGLFDGHGGTGASLAAANQLHHLLQDKLVDTQDELLKDYSENNGKVTLHVKEELVVGALEAAFREMDQLLESDRQRYAPAGGSTALVMLILFNKVYVANAGDSRAILYDGDKTLKLSNDFSPYYDRKRILGIAQERPHLINEQFTLLEYTQPVRQEHLGKRIMYRTPEMKGWAFKTATRDDLKFSVVQGIGRRSRILGVLGVARGFGDFELMGHFRLPIKPFVTCLPEVFMFDLSKATRDCFVIMATDGLWDALENKQAVETVLDLSNSFEEKHRYMCAATCLAALARGNNNGRNHWFTKDGRHASVDDISLFVIPLYPYKQEAEKMCT